MKISTLLCAAAAITLTACASTDGERSATGVDFYEGDPRLGESVSSACYGREIDGFRETRRNSVIIEGIGRREYLLTTRACFDLDSAFALGVSSRGGCLGRGDRLFVSDTGVPLAFGGASDLESCTITGIYDWNEDALKPEDAQQESAEK